MKISLLLFLILGIQFTPTESGQAKVQKIQGVDIFVMSEPLVDYDVIENGKIVITLTGGCDQEITKAAMKASKLNADGVIIFFGTPLRYTSIRYK